MSKFTTTKPLPPSVVAVVNPKNYPSDHLGCKAYAVTLYEQLGDCRPGTMQHFELDFAIRTITYRLMKFQCEEGRDSEMNLFIRMFESTFPELIFVTDEIVHTLCECAGQKPSDSDVDHVEQALNALHSEKTQAVDIADTPVTNIQVESCDGPSTLASSLTIDLTNADVPVTPLVTDREPVIAETQLQFGDIDISQYDDSDSSLSEEEAISYVALPDVKKDTTQCLGAPDALFNAVKSVRTAQKGDNSYQCQGWKIRKIFYFRSVPSYEITIDGKDPLLFNRRPCLRELKSMMPDVANDTLWGIVLLLIDLDLQQDVAVEEVNGHLWNEFYAFLDVGKIPLDLQNKIGIKKPSAVTTLQEQALRSVPITRMLGKLLC